MLVASIRDSKDPVHVDDIDVQYSKDAGRFKTFYMVTGNLEDEMAEGLHRCNVPEKHCHGAGSDARQAGSDHGGDPESFVQHLRDA